MSHVVYIRGIPDQPAIKDINVRSAPAVSSDLLFKVPVGTECVCTEIKPDQAGDNYLGQTFDWFFLTFSDGRIGWVRNDLLELRGNFANLGYGFYGVRTFAFFAAQLQRISTPLVNSASTSGSPTIVATAPGDGYLAQVREDILKVNLRTAPSRTSDKRSELAAGTQVKVRHVTSSDAEGFRWIYVGILGAEGYVREDLLNYSADCIILGLTPSIPPSPQFSDPIRTNRYGAPLQGRYTKTTGYNQNGHKGIDLALPAGASVYAGASGKVIGIIRSIHSTPARPSSLDHGYVLNDSRVINNREWGYGFGNALIMRYDWNVLPKSAREKLARDGRTNYYANVIYAHLSEIAVSEGALVAHNTLLGKTGNTGNSTGPHLHIEIRLSATPDRFGFDNMLGVGFPLEDPALFFNL